MIKLLSTIGFLLASGLAIWVGNLTMKRSFQALRGAPAAVFVSYLFSVALLLLGFVQYWLLTRVFPLQLILALLGTAFICQMIFTLIGSIAGFTIEEKKEKIAALSVIWGAQQGKLGCAYMLFSTIFYFGIWLASLWIFWKHSIGDPKARVLITFFLLLLPPVVTSLWQIVLSWPTMTSEYIDDDLRNAQLSARFSNLIYFTISLVFPLWIIEQDVRALYGTFPPFWLLLSFPLLEFLVGGALPFFIGMRKFRTQVRVMLEWRRKWLKGVLEFLKLPVGSNRLASLDEKLDQLQDEINANVSKNQLFAFYQRLLKDDFASQGKFLDVLATTEITHAALPTAAGDTPAPANLERSLSPVVAKVLQAKDAFRGLRSVPARSSNEVAAQVEAIIRDNRNRMVEWDARFAHTYKLIEMYQYSADAHSADIRDSIQFQLEEIDKDLAAFKKGKNILAGSSLSAATAVVIWLFKNFEDDLVSLVKRLVGAA